MANQLIIVVSLFATVLAVTGQIGSGADISSSTVQEPESGVQAAEQLIQRFNPFEGLFKKQIVNLMKPMDLMQSSSNNQEVSARHHSGLLLKDLAYKLSVPEEVVEKFEKGVILGFEACLKSANYALLLLERTFIPDVCLLKQMCTFGLNLSSARTIVEKISPSTLEGSVYMRALTRGILGVSCEDAFICHEGPSSGHSMGGSGYHQASEKI